nr:glycosyltransferase [Natrinema sp. CBA1119]
MTAILVLPDASLGIIGNVPERDRLEQQAQTIEYADRVTMLGFLKEYDDVLAHMRAADVFASPSTREGFGITFAEAMAADCTVIAADHPESAASEVIGDAGFLTSPTVDDLAAVLERALAGDRPSTDPTARAQRYDWDTVADQAAQCYRHAIDGTW